MQCPPNSQNSLAGKLIWTSTPRTLHPWFPPSLSHLPSPPSLHRGTVTFFKEPLLTTPACPASCVCGAWHPCEPISLPTRLPLRDRAGAVSCCIHGAWHIAWHKIAFKIFGINKGCHRGDSWMVDSHSFGSWRMDPNMDGGHECRDTGSILCAVLSGWLFWRQALLWLARPAKAGRSQAAGKRPKKGR